VSTDAPAHPPADTWVAALYASENDSTPIGTALVIDSHRVLTCAHVVSPVGAERDLDQEPLWIAFPKADTVCPRRKVASMTIAASTSEADLVVLVLAEQVPAGVERAPLRCPKPRDLAGRRWWAFGFPNHDPKGNSADGLVGTSLGYGWVRLDADSRYHVEPGFSGGGLWSPDYEAVVAVVGEANKRGDGQAITLRWADQYFPDDKIALLAGWSPGSAGEMALAAWGWSLTRDPEGVRHWRPRARGVSIESERGYRFRGRTAALTRIVSWLDRAAPDRQVLVVTGSPGVGKSAVLGRIVTTADAAIRASLPPSDKVVRARVGSVSCAVHAKGKTALEVAEEICRAASARLPQQPDDLAPAVRDALDDRGGQRFNVIIDALDEAASPAQAREILGKVVLPLAETCSDVGAQVTVGTRRRDDDGDLLGRFGGALATIDLDDPKYFAEEDLAAYALACLQLAGDERPGNPYTDDAVAIPLASRIATMSGQNFLIAGLIARARGLHDNEAAKPAQLGSTGTVDLALAVYLHRLSPVAGLPAGHVLTALAFAEAPGLPSDCGGWRSRPSTVSASALTTWHCSPDRLRPIS
jgi:Trypsin-like peptidase domain/AAA domain